MEKGKGKWVRVIHVHYMYIFGLLTETKKGGETSKSKILRILKMGI